MKGTHIHLPSIDQLKKDLENRGLEDFCKYYTGFDVFVGKSEEIRFIEEKIKEFKKEKP